MVDCVDSLVDILDDLEDRDVRPFFALGRFDGAVVPANTKNGHVGDRE
jgi:hypothetical protein